MIRILYVFNSCKNLGPTKQTLNIIKGLDKSLFEVFLITLRKEESGSLLDLFCRYAEHHYIETGRAEIIAGKCRRLWNTISDIKPDLIHSVGVFPDFLICRKPGIKHVFTVRNNIYEDFRAKYGMVQGSLLVLMQLSSIKKADRVICCSDSLAGFYRNRFHRDFDCICNGIDIDEYRKPADFDKEGSREEAGIPKDSFTFVFTGQLIRRKNVALLINAFTDYLKDNPESVLVIVGNGAQYRELKEKYSSENIIIAGFAEDVRRYLWMSDVYVSASLSEGLPNGVMEAMAAGLPVVLSNIAQHKELCGEDCGFTFKADDKRQLVECLKKIGDSSLRERMTSAAMNRILSKYSSDHMSEQYQKLYCDILKRGNESE